MEVFDTHIHSEGRSVEDLKRMRERGIRWAVTCAFYPIVPKYPETLIDHFRKLTTFEVERGKKAGMEIVPAVGIHPRCIPPNYERALESLEEFECPLGEIGLETASEVEVEVFRRQLEFAKEHDRVCIIHTPKKNKVEVTKKTLGILKDVGFPEDLAIVDHATKETVKDILSSGYYAGLTVQVGKLTTEEVVEIVEEYGFERFVINSDTGFDEANMFATVEAIEAIADRIGGDVRRLAYENALKIFQM